MNVRLICILLLLWASALCGGVWYLNQYANTAGESQAAVQKWPSTSAIRRTPGAATLVMAYHPGCPCSQASLQELRTALDGLKDVPVVHLLVSARTAPPIRDLIPTDAIPIDVIPDPSGAESAKLGARISGEVWLYSQTGDLQFHGGITGSRGHVGANTGSSLLRALLRKEILRSSVQPPVFGCALRGIPPNTGAPL